MITINLKAGENPSFVPGEKISGNVQWAKLNEGSESVEVRLIWYTVGKGDRDAQFVDAKKIDNLETGGQSDFEFSAPHRPNTFAGKLIAIQWAIEVIVFPQRDAEQATLSINTPTGEILLTPVQDKDVFWNSWAFGKQRNGSKFR